MPKNSIPNSRVAFEGGHAMRRFRVRDAFAAVGGGNVVVGDRERQFRPACFAPRFAQALEGLGAGHLMDEVAVDIDDARLPGRLVDEVALPDFVVERLRGTGVHGDFLVFAEWAGMNIENGPPLKGFRGPDGQRAPK